MKIFKLVLTLSVVCLISGLSLSYFYTRTKPVIIRNNSDREIKLKQEIIKDAIEFKKIDFVSLNYYVEESKNASGDVVGLLIKNRIKGYGGDLEYLVGITLDQEPKIINIKILSHRETPGLGAKVTTSDFLSQFVSRIATELYLKKDSKEGKIDSITGATITSRAITNSVREVMQNKELYDYIKSVQKKFESAVSVVEEKKVIKKVVPENTSDNISQ